ncbi:MAG: M23 family metallopeptidase [Holosporales bacterium]|jgi:lipoprotein NlpD|nr:M23 family metallopeptidase [Holosporales bacterium]
MMNSIRNILLSGLMVIGLTSCSGDRNREFPEIVQVERIIPYHVVEDGDTVGSIATKYNMSRSDLIKLNKLTPPYQLYDGQRLVIILRPDGDQGRVSESEAVKPGEASVPPQKSEDTKNQSSEKRQEDDVDTATISDIGNDGGGVVITQEPTGPVSDYVWPVNSGRSKISQHFEDGGITIDASAGTPVRAIADGVVKIAGVPEGDAAAYGVTVVLKHDSKNILSIYANLQEATVSKSKKVKKGDIIGKVGKSGTIAKKTQLYFEMNDLTGKERHPIDPEKVLP